jgi:hypothetical protein
LGNLPDSGGKPAGVASPGQRIHGHCL